MLVVGVACGPVIQDQESIATAALQGVQLTGVPGGYRVAAYDKTRNCLWIVTRTSVQADVLIARLSRFNISDRSTVSSVMEFPTTGSPNGGVALDSDGAVWWTWGVTIAQYNPDTGAKKVWSLPSQSNVALVPTSEPALDGKSIALAVDSGGEIWLAIRAYQALFGFNPSLGVWDRTLLLPLSPVPSALASPRAGVLLVGGVAATKGVLALVDTASGKVTLLAPHASGFALLDGYDAIYGADTMAADAEDIGKVNLSTGQAAILVSGAPLGGRGGMIADAAGNVWFPMQGNQSVGLGKLNLASNSISTYPIPQVVHHSPNVPACVQPCSLSSVFDPQIQAIVVDSSDDVWVIDRLPDTGPAGQDVYSPIYELPRGS